MAQASAGKEPLHHMTSVMITATRSPAAAFGGNDDDDDDKYSVSELSTVGAAKADKDSKGADTEAFVKATLRSHAGLERMKSVVTEMVTDTESSSTENGKPEDDPPQGAEAGAGPAQEQQPSRDAASSQGEDSNNTDVFSGDTEEMDSPAHASFALFAQTKFQLRTTHVYSCAALQGSLLPKQDKADTLASLAAWVTILRVMGDLPESSGAFIALIGEEPTVVSKVKAWYKKKYLKKDIEEAQKLYSEYFKDPISAEVSAIPFLPSGKETMLEKIQYLCALGIYRPDLRDELYCQLCKQLTNNPSRNSTVRGWVLMMLFTGCFTPSEKFAPCFRSFLREGPGEFTQKIETLTRRTSMVGTRGFPPSWLEFQAAKNTKPILLPITFMNGQRMLMEVDAATTVKELSANLAETLTFKNNDGFSIYVCLHQKISCLGHGLHRIMDAISECEQHTKQMGMRESSSLWRLFYRKEYFSPWFNAKEDPSATEIIYQQIMRGITLGEYQCQKEDVFVLLGAQKYYLENSEVVDDNKLDHHCRNWFPEEWRKDKGVPYFVEKVKDAVKANFGAGKRSSHAEIKSDIVTFASEKWSLMFSRYYDASKLQGPGLNYLDVVVGLSGKGVYVLDTGDSIRVHLPFHELARVVKHSMATHTVTITTIKGEEYSVTSVHYEDFHTVLLWAMDGLRMRSIYALVTQDMSGGVNLVRGDLLTLDKPYKDCRKLDVLKGVCKRTGKSCDVPRDLVYIPYIVEEPSADILGMFTVQLKKDGNMFVMEDEDKPHMLQKYARYHFRHSSESAVTKIFNKASFKRGRSAKGDNLWQFSKDPIKKPLLKKSLSREDAKLMACRTFTAIQQFMGDAILRDSVTDVELANRWIVEPAARNRFVRDEVFCQVIKQLTNNPNPSSEERGWMLLLMLVTTAVPSEALYEEVHKFIRGSKHILAKLCLTRLDWCKERGCRLWPPHPAEHDMMSKQQPNVRIKVFIPDNTCQTIEVSSITRIVDVKREVCTRLGLKTWEEYGLFMSFQDSVHYLRPRDYYFDSLCHAEMHWVTSKVKVNVRRMSGPVAPVLVMLKKIWVNIIPEQDKVADLSFHFPQELPNFLRGYHKSTDEESARLAALVYRAKYGTEKRSLTEKYSDICSTILPKQLLSTKSKDVWGKAIEANFDQNNGMSQDDAKVAFLKIVSEWPTYGSVFFQVKQRTKKDLPKFLLIAINMNGLQVIDSESKKVLRVYEFSSIPNWAYDEDSMTLMITEGTQVTKLLLETNVAHNMDDILMSYISWAMNMQIRRKHGFAGSPTGESMC